MRLCLYIIRIRKKHDNDDDENIILFGLYMKQKLSWKHVRFASLSLKPLLWLIILGNISMAIDSRKSNCQILSRECTLLLVTCDCPGALQMDSAVSR